MWCGQGNGYGCLCWYKSARIKLMASVGRVGSVGSVGGMEWKKEKREKEK